MELIVKPTKTVLNDYINAGCNAFLFSIDRFSSFVTKGISIKELKKILDKYPNVDIFLSLDANIFNEDLNDLKKTLREIAKLKIKGIFFYDLAILNINIEEHLNLPLIMNQNFLVNNASTCNYYKEFKVSGFCLPSEITCDELLQIKNKVKGSLFINLFGYQLMAFSKRKLVKDYFKYIKRLFFKKEHKLLFEGKTYHVIERDNGTMFLSDYILNSFDYLDKLKVFDYGILNELLLPHDNFLRAYTLYKEALDSNKYDDYCLNNLFDNLDSGFLNKKTIYKVK